ncbi:MAG TPA: uroporphyrinogen-III synthase [Prolixibacteraceae bacterium]|nr:uroporphyrinogen-III synthase [Prolixibacteraceae bacterium]
MKTPVFFIGEKLSRKTRQWLQKQHVQYIEQPFLRIEYKKPNLPFFGTIAKQSKQWVVTSTYAAHWLVRFGEQLGLNQTDRLYCWSEKQAEILKNLNLPIFVSSFSNALELAEKVISKNEGESVLFLHGDKLYSEIDSLFAGSGVSYSEVEVYKNTPVEQFVSGIFDAYLFFSPSGIDNFKASGNFPNPSSLILANENSTAREAWRVFTNKVYLSPEQEELSFVQYSIARWQEENNK